MARRIATILSLQDKMSPKLEKASKKTKDLSKEASKAKVKLGNMAVSASDKIGGLITKAGKAAGAIVGLAAGAAIKTGLSEAMDLEGYKAQIETATKDTKKAGEIMEWCMQLANKTPFEGGEVVEAASKFEAMGMSAKEWVTYAGDMAGATNKSLDQATEALIDAQAGELERLKEFGIKKADIAAKANEMFANEEIVNAKGQIVNQEKFNEALLQIMNEKFTGGMEKKAKTFRGVMSTITGIAKNGLAGIMGMKSDGTVAKGSPLDLMKEKAQALADKMIEMQQAGTFDKISKKVSEGIKKIIKYGKQAFEFVSKNKDTIMKIAKIGAAVTGVVFAIGKVIKVVRQVRAAIKAVKTAINAVKLVAMMNPTILIIMAVVAAIAAIAYAVYKNWDKIKPIIDKAKEKISTLWNNIKTGWENLKQKITTGVKNLKDSITEKVDMLKEKVSNFKSDVVGFFGGIGDGIKNAMKAAFDWVEEKINKVKEAANWVSDKVSGAKNWVVEKVTGQNANGTQYWTGGQTQINEHGPEVVDLPSGTRIYPATRSKNMGGGNTSIKVHVTIQGNVIGNKEYANVIGNEVVNKILIALRNT